MFTKIKGFLFKNLFEHANSRVVVVCKIIALKSSKSINTCNHIILFFHNNNNNNLAHVGHPRIGLLL